MTSINSLVHRRVTVLNQNVSCQDAARAMRDNQIGCVVVSDDQGRISGIVTDRDFACRLAAEFPKTDLPLSRIASHDFVCADENTSLKHIVELMEKHGIRRVPIVEKRVGLPDRCVGIVTLDDLIAGNYLDLKQVARIVRRQIGRRIGARTGAPDAHARQTLDRFYARMGEKLDLSPDLVPTVTHFLLGCLLTRITYTAAAHLIAQLPSMLHDSLLQLTPGPDRSITATKIVEELISRFQFSEAYANSIVNKFYITLEQLVDSGHLKHIKTQLPEDMRALFEEPKPLGTEKVA